MKIYYATSNKGKVHLLKTLLDPHGIEIVQLELELPEPRSYDLKEIATHKVLTAFNHIKAPVIAQDAGFYILSLNGFPRTFTNFVLATIGIKGILKLVEDEDRRCEFKNCLAYYDGELEKPVLFESVASGSLATAQRGEMKDYFWSALSLFFIPDGKSQTLAEMPPDEYWEWRKKRYNSSFTKPFIDWLLQDKS